MKISRKLLTMGLAIGACVSSSVTASARSEISVITNNRQVWQYSPSDLAHRFQGFDWSFHNGGYRTGSNTELMFWDQDIDSVSLTGGRSTNHITISIVKDAKSESLNNTGFKQLASTWKKLLDEKASASGKALPKVKRDGKESQYVTWELPDAVVVLNATWEKGPQSLGVSIYPNSYGRQVLALLKNSSKRPNRSKKSTASESVIAKALKGNTYFLKKTRLDKRDISGSPDYYLIYFSASW